MPRLRALMSSWDRGRSSSPGELALASRVSGVLWLSGAVTLLLTLALPGSMIDALWAVAVVAAFAVTWGALMLSPVRWAHGPVRLSHFSTMLSMAIVAALARVTGGADSPVLDYLWFVVVYAAFFYPPRQALAYWVGCGFVHALPFLYDGHAVEGNLARELVVVVPIYCLVGGVVVAGRELLAGATRRASELEARQRRLTEEQASLRRVATAVAAGSPPAGVFALVSLDAGRLLGADCAAIVRYPGRRPGHHPRALDARRAQAGRSGRHRRRAPRAACSTACAAATPSPAAGSTASTTACAWPHRCAAAPPCGARSSWWPTIHTSSRPAPRSACRSTPISSRRRWPTPRIAPASTARRQPTRSPACPTTARFASGWSRRSRARSATTAR